MKVRTLLEGRGGRGWEKILFHFIIFRQGFTVYLRLPSNLRSSCSSLSNVGLTGSLPHLACSLDIYFNNLTRRRVFFFFFWWHKK
jgi:hypothetical protein